MLKLRKSADRGHASHGWLKSQHTFSFADYYDPEHMGFRSLRVINEDYIQGGKGFGTHPHHDMEIITYVVKGALEHKDSMGNKTQIKPGEVQRMTAGTGVAHSEYNPDPDRETHLLQIWIEPNRTGLPAGYDQQNIESKLNKEKFILAVSKDGHDNSISIAQDANLYVGRLKNTETMNFEMQSNRYAWLQLVKGGLKVNSAVLQAGDGLAISEESALKITSVGDSEFLLFDLA